MGIKPDDTEDEGTEAEDEGTEAEEEVEPQGEGEVEEIDLDSLIDARVKANLDSRAGAGSGEKGSAGDAGGGGTSPAPSSLSREELKAALREVQTEDEHRRQHEALAAPKERPPRKGLARVIWGP